MKLQSRRTVLKVLTALPAMALWQPISEALSVRETKGNRKEEGQLNVVFHGIFVYMYDPKQPNTITAYGLKMVEPHVYWAGNWEQEDENVLDQLGPCELKGNFLEPGPAPAKTETTFPVINCKNPPLMGNATCTIRLPIPHKIVGLRPIRKLFKPLLVGDYAPCELKHLPLAYAFIYKFDAKNDRPVLANTNWKAPRRVGPVNLHIRAESPVEDMSGDGFGAIRSFLGYKQSELDLNSAYVSCRVGPDLFPGVSGVTPEEEYFLSEMFPNKAEYYPGHLQSCHGSRLSPANCSGVHGILAY